MTHLSDICHLEQTGFGSSNPVQMLYADLAVDLTQGRFLLNPGSVGQPRDGDPAASFAMFDTTLQEITYCRVPYDVDTAAKRIRDNGLPPWLADRLLVGR